MSLDITLYKQSITW